MSDQDECEKATCRKTGVWENSSDVKAYKNNISVG